MSLAGLASRYGVARAYRTDRGERVEVERDTIVAVLDALGVDTSGRGWITRELRAFDEAATRRLVEPVLIAWDGKLDPPHLHGDAAVTLTFEDGSRFDHIPVDLPIGYHRLSVSTSVDTAADALVISAPRRSWREERRTRRCGVYAPVFALHRAGESGPGDLSHLGELVDWVAAQGGDTVLTLPLLAAFLDEPQVISPYSPVSRLMWNELYAVVNTRRRGGEPTELLDYRTAAQETRAAILASIGDIDDDPVASGNLMRFLGERPEVVDYARFRAAQARHGRDWRAWPERMRDGDIQPGDIDLREVRYHSTAQWLVDRQLSLLDDRCRHRGVELGLDLAIGTHPQGYDVWRYRDIFAARASTGAPPDTFFVAGQDWGFPPILPAAARASGYDYFRRALVHHLRHTGLLRIDHVMGFNREYWVPAGAPPTAGTYVEHHGEELFAIACLESHRARAILVGEDLGTVLPATRRALRRHALLGTWVAQGALEAVSPTGTYDLPAPDSIASLNTHDMPTFAGWLAGADIDDRVALGQIDADDGAAQHLARAELVRSVRELLGAGTDEELLERLVDELGASPASIVMLNLEDLWLEARPHNVPGTSDERPNWRRPAAYGVDELDRVPRAAALLHRLHIRRNGAAPPDRPS